MFLITASTVVNASAAWDAYKPFFSVEIEANHTVHDLLGVWTFAAFDFLKTFQKMDTYKHE